MTREYAGTCLAGILLTPQIVMHVGVGCQGWSMGHKFSGFSCIDSAVTWLGGVNTFQTY